MKIEYLLSVFFIFSGGVWLPAADATVSGDYLEVRTSDVYTGPCFANGEVNLVGKEAILAWQINKGQWQGADLDDLVVVAVLKANATLGDPFADPLPTRAVLIVDERAADSERQALVHLARALAGDLISEVVKVTTASIAMQVDQESGVALLEAGDYAQIRTRALTHHDLHCGNEEVYYPPLSSVGQAIPAFTLTHRFNGEGLNSVWSSPSKRSAFLGTFAR